MPVRQIPSHELTTGTAIVFLGAVHRITAIRAGRHPEFGPHLVAVDATGWGISIYPSDRVDVLDETTDPASRPGFPDFAEVVLGTSLDSEDEGTPTRAPASPVPSVGVRMVAGGSISPHGAAGSPARI